LSFQSQFSQHDKKNTLDPEIHITKNFLTEDQCLELILTYRGKLYDSSLRNGRKNKNVRDSKTYLFRNDIELCKLFQHRRMQFQFTEYNPNNFYSWHSDYYETGRYVRKQSNTVLLNDDFTGGEIEFEDYGIVDLNVGDRVSFTPRILHQVKPVLTGVRYSLVAWAEGL
tara:strand:+ start:84 stop:590 length:507 start_codon:yes stop_codon:yes gene_type:complete